MAMQSPAVCCSHVLLSPSFSRPPPPSFPASRRRSISISFAAFPFANLRLKQCICRLNNASGGNFLAPPVSVGFLGRSTLPRKVFAYLPHSEDSNGAVKEANLSTGGSDVGEPPVGVRRSGAITRPGSSARGSFYPFRGKSGSVSFCGLTHHMLEERKLVSSPFKDGTGSLEWVLGPLALVSSLLVPQFFLPTIVEFIIRDEILSEIVTSMVSEIIFYFGLASFLSTTDRVQRPYLDFSPKRWSLITGLRGYLSSAFFTMGFKVVAPILAAYVVWPVIGLPAAVAIAPFLMGCAAQYAFEKHLDKRNSSCWPLVPIIFELYRLYQLNKGAHFMERLIYLMRGSSRTPAVMESGNALISMLAVFQILGVVCLWSLVTFLIRLFPSRPVVENY